MTDLYESSEHFYTEWCNGHPGRKPEINFEYVAQRLNAVESGRTKLRACILLTAVRGATASRTIRTTEEDSGMESSPPSKMAKTEEIDVATRGLPVPPEQMAPLVRPPGMPPLMPPEGSVTVQPPAGESTATYEVEPPLPPPGEPPLYASRPPPPPAGPPPGTAEASIYGKPQPPLPASSHKGFDLGFQMSKNCQVTKLDQLFSRGLKKGPKIKVRLLIQIFEFPL